MGLEYLPIYMYHEITVIRVGRYSGPMEHIGYTIPYWLRETGVSGASWCRANVGSHWCVEPSDIWTKKTGKLDIADSFVIICFALCSVFTVSPVDPGSVCNLEIQSSGIFPCCSRNKNNKTVWHKVNSRKCPFRRKSNWWKPKPSFYRDGCRELQNLIWCFHVFSKI